MAKRNNIAKKDMAEVEILTGVVDEDITVTETADNECKTETVPLSIWAKIIRIENKSIWVQVEGNGYIIPKEGITDDELVVGQMIIISPDSIAASR